MGKFHRDLAIAIASKCVDDEGQEIADPADDQVLIKVCSRCCEYHFVLVEYEFGIGVVWCYGCCVRNRQSTLLNACVRGGNVDPLPVPCSVLSRTSVSCKCVIRRLMNGCTSW